MTTSRTKRRRKEYIKSTLTLRKVFDCLSRADRRNGVAMSTMFAVPLAQQEETVMTIICLSVVTQAKRRYHNYRFDSQLAMR